MFRDVTVLQSVLARQFVAHRRDHQKALRFEFCEADGCNEMRESARKAFVLYNASGHEGLFREAMSAIYHIEGTSPHYNMPIPSPRVMAA